MKEFYIGLLLALASSLFIGVSFILKKKALLKSKANNNKPAGLGGHKYLKEWLWWAGVSVLGAGEACNFAAFAFAPASLVTSLGALSVLVTVVLSSRILKEKLGFLGKVGCALCILGATMIVIHAPRDGSVKTTTELGEKMQHYGFIIYVVFVVAIASFLIFYLAPRYGRTNIFIFIAICSVIGSITVLGCKGLGLAIKEQFTDGGKGSNYVDLVKSPLLWLWLGVVIFCISVQLNYLNKALDIYNISMVTSIYYVGFNCCVLMATAILYNEWTRLGIKDIIGSVCGFCVTVIGVFQMQCFNHLHITLSQLKKQIYKSTEAASSDGEQENSQDSQMRRRRSLVGSTSEPLMNGVHLLNGSAVSYEKNGSQLDNDYFIPVHSGKMAEDLHRQLSV